MRLSLAEWLLIPLLVLPLLASVGFCVYVRQSHFERIADHRENGAARIAAWLEREPGLVGALAQRMREDVRPRANDVRFSIDGEPGLVRLDGEPTSTKPWRFTRQYAGSYRAEALAASDARVFIESGDGGQFLEPGAATFAELIATPDLARLRDALLPAKTKLYLLRRWPGNYDEAITIVRASLCAGARQPGVFRVHDFFVLSDGETQVITEARPHPQFSSPVSRDGRFRLRFEHDDPSVWRGRLETPIAGEWALEVIDAGRWWTDPLFRRWIGPVSVAQLAFLLFPLGIFVAVRRLRLQDRARVRFINELAHDLRTPLTSVRMHAELLAMGRAPAGEHDRYVSVLARESARLSGVLANLLDLSHLESGSRSFSMEAVSVQAAVDEAIRDFVALYPEREQDVHAAGANDAVVHADHTALARCLGNLLDNAGKYTPAGTAIAVEWNNSEIRVTDDGPGVPPSDRGKLFQRYVRGRDAGRDGVPGTGMGLALVRELAEGMGGSVRYAPTKTGACFLLRFSDG